MAGSPIFCGFRKGRIYGIAIALICPKRSEGGPDMGWIERSKRLFGVLVVLLGVSLSGCEEKGPMEQAGEKIDEAVEEAGDKLEQATDR